MLPVALALIHALAGVVPMPSASPVAPESAPVCPAVAIVRDVGRACRNVDGLLEIRAPDGTVTGTTHGPDAVRPGDLLPAAGATLADPACADPLLDPFHVRVIYARAHDDDDRFSSLLGSIRGTVRVALGTLSDAAAATGASGATFKLRCDAVGDILVDNVVLPTNKTDADFDTITRDLRALGYADRRAKHWVLYDDPGACTCGGQGHLAIDDSPYPSNTNNGNSPLPMFAVNYGYVFSSRIWLHELGHNLGAVQNSAPRSTRAGHCIDGRDTMCYADGGSRAGEYTQNVCSVEVFDCGKDDYFNLQPAPDTYLSRRWNLGSLGNRYLAVRGIPQPTVLDPAPGAAYRGCTIRTLGRPDPRAANETSAAVVAGPVCVRLEVREIAASRVSLVLDGIEFAAATTPGGVAPDGTQTWELEAPHPAPRGLRFLSIRAEGVNGFVSKLDVPIFVV